MDRNQAARQPGRTPDALRDAPVPSAANTRADRLEAKGDVQSRGGPGAPRSRADRYTLGVVLFATSLFFAGISTRLRTQGSRLVALSVGWAAFLGAVIWMVTFPVSVGL